MNCFTYARVSTEKQAEKELSIPAQLQAMRDFARQHDWTIVSEFIEPGASAKTTDRPALQDLLARVRNGDSSVEVVLVHKIDRLARNVYDHATIKAVLTQRGVRLASVTENTDTSVSGELVENIMASIAQFYSANLSEEVKKGMRQKVLQGGWPHRPPMGYRIVRSAEGSALEIDPVKGPLVRRAFELYATGWFSIDALSRRLAADGLVARNGNPVAPAHLRRLLAHSFYTGVIRWNGLEVKGAHESLVSRDLFQEVQLVIDRRFKNPGVKGSQTSGFPLRGIAMCAHCRGRMTSERHGRWLYYRCSRQTFRRELCDARYSSAPKAHKDIELILKQLALTEAFGTRLQEAIAALLASREASLAASDREGARLVTEEQLLSREFAAGRVPAATYRERMKTLRAARPIGRAASPVTATQLAELAARMVRTATSCFDLYRQLGEMRQAQLMHVLFDAVILDLNGVVGYTLRPPFDALLTGVEPDTAARAVLTSAGA